MNEGWLLQLTAKVRRALRGLSSNMVGRNGAEFISECFSETAFAYAVIQIMEPGQRLDPEHFDGGASLLHMGITIFGSRKGAERRAGRSVEGETTEARRARRNRRKRAERRAGRDAEAC